MRVEDLLLEHTGSRITVLGGLHQGRGKCVGQANGFERVTVRRSLASAGHCIGDRERKKLQLIEDALHRIDTGEYGECEECGGEIVTGRLDAMPFTRLCVTCQDEHEQAQRTMHVDSGGMAAPRYPASDAEDDTF